MKMLDSKTIAKIVSLKRQIDFLYKEAKARPTYMQCHICGAGDFTTRQGILLKTKSPIHGYINRPSQSPRLCHRHANGWAHTHNWHDPFNEKSAEEIDLHFAEYLAKQLMKATPTKTEMENV